MLKAAAPLTHVEALVLTTLPESLIVLGGGYIGLEMAQAFGELGSKVTLIQDAPRVAMREEEDVTEAIETALKEEGIDVRTGVRPARVTGKSGESVTLVSQNGSMESGRPSGRGRPHPCHIRYRPRGRRRGNGRARLHQNG